MSNGLGSPSCRGASASELSATDRRHCESSGFVASSAPTGDYGIDVHIDTGILDFGSGWLSSAVQDLVVTPIWMGLVWAVHALVVMLEWCFTIDLLPSAAAGGLGAGLRHMEANFTQPWLPLALAVASMLSLYHGLVRRRVAETVGEALLMVAMMLAGLWVISDPAGTVGALGGWANQAALGTLAVASQGAPSAPERTFATNLDALFSSAIEGPWCYLEFGDVAWCRDPGRLDPRLRQAALKIAVVELGEIGCDSGLAASATCVAAGSAAAKTLEHSAEMLREAQSNGAIFLALPPNGPARNSINQQGSLLRTMCQSTEATNCRGEDAAQAQFRTGAQTWSRLGGLLLIAAGLLGMLLLVGFLTLRLLAAALFSLLYLLLAPAMVLSAAFGEGGRELFRRWGLQLLGTVVAKLLFSFLLGVMLAVVGVISSLTALGWWTQWLLISALWWGAYVRRHRALGLAAGSPGHQRAQRGHFGRRIGNVLEARGRSGMTRWSARRDSREAAPNAGEHPTPAQQSRLAGATATVGSIGSALAARAKPGVPTGLAARAARVARADVEAPPGAEGSPGLDRHEHPPSEAQARSGRRGPSDGQARADTQAQSSRPASSDMPAGSPASSDTPARSRGGSASSETPARSGGSASSEAPARSGGRGPSDGRGQSEQLEVPRRSAQLERVRRGGRRAELAGDTRRAAELGARAGRIEEELERLDPRRRRDARREIDRELAAQRMPSSASAAGREARPRGEDPAPADAGGASAGGDGVELPRRGRASESSVMRDVAEVQAGRKRHLGLGRP